LSYFDDETALRVQADGHWQGRVSPHWNIGANPNGGYLVAIALRALLQYVPEHPDPMTVTSHFLRPGVANADCEVVTELLRKGKTLSTLRASLHQDGKARVEVLATLGKLAATTAAPALTLTAPQLPPPERCVSRSGAEQGIELPIMKRLDIRLHPAQARAGASGVAEVSGWIRFCDGATANSLAAVMFSDAFPPSVFGLLGVVGWVPTIELTVQVRRRPVAGWLCGRFRTRDLLDGRMVEDGALWDSNNNLVAQSRQLALVIPTRST
jgi:acyl-CoA thioesterase